MLRKIALFICPLLWSVIAVQAQDIDSTRERIISFHADIVIAKDGRVTVTEHIKVHSEGEEIRRGIKRFIPLKRKDRLGVTKKAGFDITSVQKNGEDEPYHTEDASGNRTIYMGSSDTYLTPGNYDYSLTYHSYGHVGFFSDYDELYWNVTGSEWDFVIENASATIHFPEGATPGNTACYTGKSGSTDQYCISHVNPDGSVTFRTENKLWAGEGFTIAAAFTPNIIQRPGPLEMFYNDYKLAFFSGLLVILAALTYFIVWRIYGRDPRKPVVVPSFHIPNNWSPALIRYFYAKTIDNKATAAAFINIAVKRRIKIVAEKKRGSIYKFERTNKDITVLSTDEASLVTQLFKSASSIDTKVSNAPTFEKARAAFSKTIKNTLKLSEYFTRNVGKTILVAILTLVAMLLYFLMTGYVEGLPVLFVLPFWSIGLLVLISSFKTFKKSWGLGIFLFIFGFGFFGGTTAAGYLFLSELPVIGLVTIGLVALMFILFVANMAAYTQEGIVIQSQIEGFKMYLETAEEHRLNMLNPPEHTPEVFERFLPYAIALNVENAWGEKFAGVLQSTNYEADWYSSQRMSFVHFTSALPSSFYSAVQVSRPTSSSGGSGSSSGSSSWSSGSSGGGSSGGGGGGGGGGGW